MSGGGPPGGVAQKAARHQAWRTVGRRRLTQVGAKLALAQAGHEARQREILLEQRAQIAHELHDIVAHSVSVILLQVGAARMRALDQPSVAEPLHAAESSGRQALAELRRLLGVLHDSPGEDRGPDHAAGEREPDPPQPSIATLDRLASTVRTAGLAIDLAIVGEVRPLPPGLELSVYRIVQEALTNVLKHAQASTARVRVDYGPGAVTIDVVDDGTARTTSDRSGNVYLVLRCLAPGQPVSLAGPWPAAPALALVTCPGTPKALFQAGKGLDLRKLVAGAEFEPATSIPPSHLDARLRTTGHAESSA